MSEKIKEYIKMEIESGDVWEGIVTHQKIKKMRRKPKINKSTAEQMIKNEKNAKRKLSRLINSNFHPGDLFFSLTYEGDVPDLETAKRNLVNYLRRIRYSRKKSGLPDIKYIAVTESLTGRIHHHIIMSAMSMDTVSDLWPYGRVTISKLFQHSDYTGLAQYITKESATGEERRENERHWTQSRNLEKPKVIKALALKTGSTPIKVPKGYRILEMKNTFDTQNGNMQYVRAIRIGGVDFFEGWTGTHDSSGVPGNDRTKKQTSKVPK